MTNDQSKTLGELIIEALELRNLSVEKLSELTDIPAHYLIALKNDDLNKLPSAPYTRGYLIKIAEILKIDINRILTAYKLEISLRPMKTSGSSDKLPFNRFSFGRLAGKNVIIAGIILILISIYLILRTSAFLGTPKIEIINPLNDNVIINNSTINLLGKISAKDKLIINGEEVLAEENGGFEKYFSLQPGINTFEFKVKRFLGKEIKVIRQVIYQPH
ncbi:MAG: helix-turn-helix domain-containing protein [Patescibacteria group bacterium]